MKNNSKKYGGFTLIEVVISIAILSIMSISVYDGLMIIIKQTKAGQVKQEAALEGKKIIENMKASSFKIPGTIEMTLNIGGDIFQKEEDHEGNIFYTRYVDKDYAICNKDVSKYKEKVTLTPAKAFKTPQTTGQSVELNTDDGSRLKDNKLYVSKIVSQDCMRYWKYSENNKYTPVEDSLTVQIPMPSNSESKIEMSVYFTTTDTGYQNIEIKDYKGVHLLSIDKDDTDDKDLVINFSNYVDSNGAVPINAEIELDIYNKTTADIPKIYIEKLQALDVNVEARKGEINVYNNRAEDLEENNVGTLYDIKLEINEDNNNLFTGYDKKNMH
ncbi:MAG: type II secretion system GspH family protein [Clostridium sp.]|uniref:PulJ/GspJ family protein n=1 Tax=Clostridium sp. TaxID=1506 RepID=UPI0025C0E63F|nr:type II secretion system protein [Clostridium sp.]MCE5221061.1 type II secretion system GspH family protein [Clostridium sp.]